MGTHLENAPGSYRPTPNATQKKGYSWGGVETNPDEANIETNPNLDPYSVTSDLNVYPNGHYLSRGGQENDGFRKQTKTTQKETYGKQLGTKTEHFAPHKHGHHVDAVKNGTYSYLYEYSQQITFSKCVNIEFYQIFP